MPFELNLKESFPNLTNAPIVEAVIHWRAHAEKDLQPDALLKQLEKELPDYPNIQPQYKFELKSELKIDGETGQNVQWNGFRCESEDKLYIAQFTRNGFVFSRLDNYENWTNFSNEAKRLWKIYVDLTGPSEIQRLGVRFINKIDPMQPEGIDNYLSIPPQNPDNLELPIQEFMHQYRWDVPNHPYNINVIQSLQSSQLPETNAHSLIVDIDVFTTKILSLEDNIINNRLTDMQWLKNKAFFSLLTEAAIEQFKEPQNDPDS